MSVVRFDQIARECRETFKGSFEGKPIVGLEHIEPYDMLLKNYDVDVETTFTKSFKKGQILFGRRRAYQHKACVATIDGICSGDITVIEPIEGKVYPDLLPFIIQNDDFFEHAIKGSNGALSPRVKWEHMASFEFDLPSLAEQKVLAEKLWAAYEVKQSYLKMIAATEEMVKAHFIEMFGDPISNPKGWPVKNMKESSVLLSDGPFGSNLKSEHYCEEGVRVIRLQNICLGYFDDTDKAYISVTHYEKLKKYTCKPGEIVIGTLGEPNFRACIIPSHINLSINKADCVHYIPKAYLLNNTFACSYINCERTLQMATSNIHGTTRARIAAGQVNNIPIYIPPINLQKEFETIYNQADKSISELRKSIDAIDKVIKSLINENL